MLHYTVVDSETLELLKTLMQADYFREFRLVGGTALALQIGHRKSLDLDLFIGDDFDTDATASELRKIGEVRIIAERRNTLNLTIDGIKVDLIAYRYPLIRDILVIDGIRMYSKEDMEFLVAKTREF